MYPILCITADSTLQDAGHVTATRRPTPLAVKLVKYSPAMLLCSPGVCETTCYGSRDPTRTHVDTAVQIKLRGTIQKKHPNKIKYFKMKLKTQEFTI